MTDLIDHLDLPSQDIAEQKRQELLNLFPEIRTEGGKLDFERLKLALGEAVDVGKERYGMNWPGKADCFKTIQLPSVGTLLPCPDESVNFDKTENLIIEGDNLEVLKLLQKSYLGKVKLIYIDPPYNTGNDFIYPDNYAESLQTYLQYTGQVDAEGKKFNTNTDTDGRFHSKWMNMMYPRLYLARNLLCDDGLIFISIDDAEVTNLRKVCDEIYGEENWVGTLVWEKKKKGAFLSGNVTNVKEYVVVYAKNSGKFGGLLGEIARQGETYPVIKTTNTRGVRTIRAGIPSKYRELNYEVPAGTRISSGNMEMILLDPLIINDGQVKCELRVDSNWIYSQELLDEYAEAKELYVTQELYFRRTVTAPREKRLKDLLPKQADVGTTGSTFILNDNLFLDGWGTNEDGFDELHGLLGEQNLMDFPKPSKLLAKLITAATRSDKDSIILDFFAGSGTTAQALLDLNRQDGGKRRFILVQLPEPLDPEEKNQRIAARFCDTIGKPRTIAEITKERVRRVITKFDAEDASKLDLDGSGVHERGFRVYKLAESNFRPWNADLPRSAAALGEQLELHIDHIREGRSAEDILHEILLKSGFPLTTPVETLTLSGKTVHSAAGGALFICLDRNLTLELIRAMAELKPERVVCLDEGFAGNDQLKANAVQIFKTKGITSFKTV